MIQLVVSCDTHPDKTYDFDQQSVIVGREGAPGIDIPIDDESLADIHLTITRIDKKDGYSFTAVNTTNDPFCSFNDLPFGKRRLHVGDTITIGPAKILCKQLIETSESSPTPPPMPAEPAAEEPAPTLVSEAAVTAEELPPAPSEAKPARKPSKPKPVALPKKIVQNDDETEATPTPPLKTPKLSIKDDYLREYDDDSETSPFRKRERDLNGNNPFLQAPKSWSMIGKFLAASIGALAIVLGLLYMNIRDTCTTEENHTAKGLADIAMALAHAQVHQLHPQSHNWSEPDFIQTNLQAVLAPEHSPLATFDTHGMFTGCSYLLRIYTETDLNSFVVIAQPAPSVLQWLVPKASFVVDSKAMEIRKIYDLRAINRLLINSSDLKEDKELIDLIAKGELVPLSSLVTAKENQGFSPPKTLPMIHPGAENYIYNAPRYYPMGENFIDRMIAIFDQPSSSNDIYTVQQELHILHRFPHLLLYTSKGIERASQAQKALTMLAPNEKFLLAYTQANSKGKIINAHILVDEGAEKLDHPQPQAEEIAYRGPTKSSYRWSDSKDATKRNALEASEDLPELSNPPEEVSGVFEANRGTPIDSIQLQLTSLVTSRTLTLKPVSDEIASLVASHTMNWSPQFAERYVKTQEKYTRVDEEQKEKITKALATFMQEHRHLPAAHFLEYVTLAKATPYFQGYLDGIKIPEGDLEANIAAAEASIEAISTSMSWATLEEGINKAVKLLNFEHIPNIATLVQYQNELSSRVINKLNQLLLSSNQSLSAESFTTENHDTLMRILELAWIEDPETHRFYLSEFDLHRR